MPKLRRLPVETDRRFRGFHPHADHGPRERWQHSGRILEFTDRAGILAARATEEHVLDHLLAAGHISPPECEAGLKFKLDYQYAGLEARITGRYTASSNARDFFGNTHERTDKEEAAYQRWRLALREVGLRYSNAVVTTVCHDIPPTPLNLPLLRQGLKILVDWYGMEK